MVTEVRLRKALTDREAKVGVVALGYVGLPLARAFVEAGFPVLGFDTDPTKIEMLGRGENYLKHLGGDFVRTMIESGRFEASGDLERLSECDAVLICVPTPLGDHHEPDLSFIERAGEAVGRALRPGQLVVLESTTYPGTTREVLLPRVLDASAAHNDSLECGRDFFVAYSPEREDPGRQGSSPRTIPKLVGGLDETSGDLAVELYRQAVEQVVPVSSAEIAEAAKILENVYRAVNIALVNELKQILTAMNVDVWEVIEAAATKPFGFQAFYPGPGLGGHCIPIDPFYLTWKAREVGEPTRFIELAGQVNTRMPEWVIGRCMLALNGAGKSVKGSRVLVLGLAYKPDVDDVRESPSFELIRRLRALGAEVDFHDPHVQRAPRSLRHYPDLENLERVELTQATLERADLVLIATHHSDYDWGWIATHAPLVVDTRGVMRQLRTDAHVWNA